MIYKVFCIVFISILASHKGNSQTVARYPASLQVESWNATTLPPLSSFSDSSLIEGHIYSRQYLGMFSDVRELESGMQYATGKSKIGAAISTDKEGLFISTSRAYINYSFSVQLSSRWLLSAGVNAGLVNISVGNNTRNIQAAGSCPDMGMGVSVRSRNAIVKLSITQALNRELVIMEIKV